MDIRRHIRHHIRQASKRTHTQTTKGKPNKKHNKYDVCMQRRRCVYRKILSSPSPHTLRSSSNCPRFSVVVEYIPFACELAPMKKKNHRRNANMHNMMIARHTTQNLSNASACDVWLTVLWCAVQHASSCSVFSGIAVCSLHTARHEIINVIRHKFAHERCAFVSNT